MAALTARSTSFGAAALVRVPAGGVLGSLMKVPATPQYDQAGTHQTRIDCYGRPLGLADRSSG